tara:strand:- start:3979 stop:4560 length:582 start_codon:yes stop_codon:yes gene_type:complete
MGEVKNLTPENGDQDQNPPVKVTRVLGGDIESKEFEGKDHKEIYEILSERFDKLQKELDIKSYDVTFTQEQIAFLIQDILPKVEWVGQQAWDISEAQKVIVEFKPGVAKSVGKPSIRAIFQFVATQKYVGVDNVSKVSDLLTTFATIIQQHIGKDEQTLRDAGFELQAAEVGITPENAMQQAMLAENAAEGQA